MSERQQFWELAESDPRARVVRATVLRLLYATCNPNGWDARRARRELGPVDLRAAFRVMTRCSE